MSIEDFEHRLKSKLLHKLEAHGESSVIISANEWWLVLSEPEYECLHDICVNIGSMAVSRVDNIAKLEQIIERNNLEVDVYFNAGWYAPYKKNGVAHLTILTDWTD